MRFGNCVGIYSLDKIKMAAEVGFDYIELAAEAVFEETPQSVFDAPQSVIDAYAAELEKYKLKCEAMNAIFKKDFKIAGEKANTPKAIWEYLSALFSKTKILNYDVVVLGSAGARKVEDSFPKETAMTQIISLCRDILCEFAEKYDFIIAVEEMYRGDTNVINLMSEARIIVNEVNSPRCKLLLDYNHIALNDDDISSIASFDDIIHTHIANTYKRHYPLWTDRANAEGKYKLFIDSLKNAGYNNRISIESVWGGLGESPFARSIGKFDNKDECMYSLEFVKYLYNL